MDDNNGMRSAEELLHDELVSYCESDFSEEGLREIFQRHGLRSNADHNCSYGFFHWACHNESVTEGIIRCLLEYFPDDARATDSKGRTPLHSACHNRSATLNIIKHLIDVAPESVRSVTDGGSSMPLHYLCQNNKLDEETTMQILKLLIEKYPAAVRHANINGYLPIHLAAAWVISPEVSRVLIEAYPGSERISDVTGDLPLHHACYKGSLAAVKYLYGLSTETINVAAASGHYPIHNAIAGTNNRDNPATAVAIVKFLQDCDPNQKLKLFHGWSLLHYACQREFNDSNIEAGIQVIKIIFDAHPEAIEDDEEVMSHIHDYHPQVHAFINGELVYAQRAKDLRLMNTPDDSGRLPLHRALQSNVRLGSIKLLVKGNPSAIRTFDRSSLIPLHIACQHHNSTDVVRYLVELDTAILDTVDRDGNTALHHACQNATYDTIAMLLEDYDAISVSRQNYQQKLPIDLLWDSSAVDRDDLEYVESTFRLLKAYPETVVMRMANEQAFPPNGKKRKFGK